MEIKILGTGCRKCRALEKAARKAVEELGLEAELKKVTDIKDIMEYDILLTPGLVINQQVVVSGRVPKLNEIKQLLLEALNTPATGT
ncbi:MAG: thioredoxin family protein [Firmicutes bacterium]|nr:thioredoxin family protein [Bacillota bacterium]